MSKQVEWTIKGFIIGALIDYALRFVFRLIFGVLRFSLRFWYIVFPLIAYLYAYHAISRWWKGEAERDAILSRSKGKDCNMIYNETFNRCMRRGG